MVLHYDWINYMGMECRNATVVQCLWKGIIIFFRIVLMPGTDREQVFSFPATQVSEGKTIGNVPANGNNTADGKMDVKFVMRYCQLKEK